MSAASKACHQAQQADTAAQDRMGQGSSKEHRPAAKDFEEDICQSPSDNPTYTPPIEAPCNSGAEQLAIREALEVFDCPANDTCAGDQSKQPACSFPQDPSRDEILLQGHPQAEGENQDKDGTAQTSKAHHKPTDTFD